MSSPNQQLLSAARLGRWRSVRRALQKGADINSKDEAGKCTALQLAIQNGHWDVADRFLDIPAIDLNAVDAKGNTAFLYACWTRNMDMIQELVTAGADPHYRNHIAPTSVFETDCDALEIACVAQDVRMASYLLKQCNCDPNLGSGRLTALHHACQNSDDSENSLRLFALLLDNGADPNARFRDQGSTPLLYAVKLGRLEEVRLFLDRGAHINDRGYEGKTSLHVAMDRLNENADEHDVIFAIVQELIRHGADISLRDDKKRTAFDVASRRGFSKCSDVLLTAFTNQMAQRHGPFAAHAIFRGAVFEDEGGNRLMNPCSKTKYTPHHPLAVRLSGIGTLTVGYLWTLFQSLGPNLIQHRDPFTGALPVHVACAQGAGVSMLRLFVEHGGIEMISARDRDGALPLHHLLAAKKPHSKLKAVEFLLNSYPRSASTKTTEGYLPFMIASEANCTEDVLFLLLKAYPEAVS